MATQQWVQAVLALVFVLALLLGLAWLVRRMGLVARITPPGAGARAEGLHVSEILSLDMRHKVVRVRDGRRSYLVILGGEVPVVLAAQTDNASGIALSQEEQAA
jgi:flagellar protein FliO/FliZ